MPRDDPTPLHVWTWQDPQVERPTLLDEALEDIAGHGCFGAPAMLRDRFVHEGALDGGEAAAR